MAVEVVDSDAALPVMVVVRGVEESTFRNRVVVRTEPSLILQMRSTAQTVEL